MSCPTETDLLCLVSGELSGQRRQTVVDHVDQCAICARRVQEMRDLWTIMGSWQPDVTGHEVAECVLGAITREPGPRSTPWGQPWRWPVPLRAAASILLGIGIGWGADRVAPQRLSPSLTSLSEPNEPVTPEAVARDMGLAALSGGVPTGLAISLLDEERQPTDQEDKG